MPGALTPNPTLLHLGPTVQHFPKGPKQCWEASQSSHGPLWRKVAPYGDHNNGQSIDGYIQLSMFSSPHGDAQSCPGNILPSSRLSLSLSLFGTPGQGGPCLFHSFFKGSYGTCHVLLTISFGNSFCLNGELIQLAQCLGDSLMNLINCLKKK